MSGPYKNDSQYAGGLPTLVYPSAISGKMGQFGGTRPITQGGARPAQISSGNRSLVSPRFGPLASDYVQAPQFLRGQTGPITGGGYGNRVPWNPLTDSSLFSGPGAGPITGGGGGGINGPRFDQQYTDTSYGGQQDVYRGGKVQFNPQGAGAGAGAGDGMHPEEKKWKILAEKYGVNWDVTKNVYMRSPRNPNFSPSTALELQLDDKAWGDAALAAGILTGNPDYDKNVWDDHYLANGNMARDPMAGHNYAQMAYQANQQAIQDQVNGVPTPPEWLG
jgi:hypothetical protein